MQAQRMEPVLASSLYRGEGAAQRLEAYSTFAIERGFEPLVPGLGGEDSPAQHVRSAKAKSFWLCTNVRRYVCVCSMLKLVACELISVCISMRQTEFCFDARHLLFKKWSERKGRNIWELSQVFAGADPKVQRHTSI
jgi:hypothetical protein